MMRHTALGKTRYARAKALILLLHAGRVRLAGNSKLKIYGTLQCASGKRMQHGNRVFFMDEAEALQQGYRPCGHCQREKYTGWKVLNQ